MKRDIEYYNNVQSEYEKKKIKKENRIEQNRIEVAMHIGYEEWIVVKFNYRPMSLS